MTDQIEDGEFEPPADTTPTRTELEVLKDRADFLGVSYGPNIGVEKLKERIQAKLDGDEEKKPTQAPDVELTDLQKKAAFRKAHWRENMALIRCRIVCLNPNKADLRGEVFTVQNKILGKVSKFIPFGEETDDGWHIPKILYENMKERKFVQINVKKNRDKRVMLPDTRWVNEFAIEVLPPLSVEELRILANKQAAANGMAT